MMKILVIIFRPACSHLGSFVQVLSLSQKLGQVETRCTQAFLESRQTSLANNETFRSLIWFVEDKKRQLMQFTEKTTRIVVGEISPENWLIARTSPSDGRNGT